MRPADSSTMSASHSREADGATPQILRDQSSVLSLQNADPAALIRRLTTENEELHRSERYFRHLTEYSLDLITILDPDGTIRFESRSIETVLGWNEADYRGRNAFEFVHPDDAPRVMQAFLNALQNQGHTPVLSFRFRHRDGSYRVLEGRGNNLVGDAAVKGIVFNSRDVTEQRRLEEQLTQSQKVQALGQLTGGVAHDFNNILTAIIGYSEVALAKMSADSAEAGAVREIRVAGERAAALTRQLLAFSRKQILQPRVVNLAEVVDGMGKMLQRLLGERIELITNAHSPLFAVKADLNQIEQVLLNLAVNARDAMPEGGKLTIEVRNAHLDELYATERMEVTPGEYVLLAVSDTGCGMSAEVRARMFEPFFTTKEQGKGTGLGLATCHGIIKQSGGHIAVYSEVGVGTSFMVYLPKTDEEATPLPVGEAPQPTPNGHETVLLVEDEPMLRELGQMVLEELGYRVLVAENGCDALRVVQETPDMPIDLLFTDVVMPKMGGRELAEKLRPIQPQAKVIFCSGYTEDAIIHSGSLEAGAFFLQKPYSVASIAQKVRNALSS
jgi:two-component system, cell cycle sensor histidine kinase and response regulator CckA